LNAKTWLVLGASLGVLGVAAGTFGAHALPEYLRAAGADSDLSRRQVWWETGVRYQMYHALALIGVAWVADRRKSLLPSLAGISMFAGTLIFSSCLYVLALTGQTFIGAIVPIGGVLFIAGWILLALAGGGLVESQDKQLTAREKLLSQSKSKPEEPAAEEPAAEESAARAD
jgi:uncharacterized membrane protein YgdD (TMEM256/DUF423 family)